MAGTGADGETERLLPDCEQCPIGPSKRLQATEVMTVLYGLKLVKRWNSIFALAKPLLRRITLLRTAPTGIVALWQSEVQMQIAEAIGGSD